MNYQEAVDLLLVTLSKIEAAGFDADAVDDYSFSPSSSLIRMYLYVLMFDEERDECVWHAVPQ